MNNVTCGCNQTPYKSTVWSIILPMVLGPIGVLYASAIASIILLVLFFVSVAIAKSYNTAGGALLMLVWLFGIYFTAIRVQVRNCRLYKACQPGSCETTSCDTGKSCGM